MSAEGSQAVAGNRKFIYMLLKVGLAITLSVAAYTIAQRRTKSAANRSGDSAENIDKKKRRNVEDEKEIFAYATDGSTQEKEVVEVKGVDTVSPSLSSKSLTEDEQLLLPEFDELLSGEVQFPPENAIISRTTHYGGAEKQCMAVIYDGMSEQHTELHEEASASHAVELERLRNLVRELEEKEEILEAELLQYYGFKEQETSIVELQRRLKINTVEIEMLNLKLNTLEAEKKTLEEELTAASAMKEELGMARAKIRELQRHIQIESGQTKAELLLLKQQIATLQDKEKEALKTCLEVENKLQTLKELEVEVMQLKRTNKELQHEKRELIVKLDAAEAQISSLSKRTETEMFERLRDEADALRHANEDLLKQVEELQNNRFSEVEEFVYLRWINACLRYELRNFQAPLGKVTARDLNKSLSPRSQERAKQLMLEYAGPEFLALQEEGHMDNDLNSVSCYTSTPSESGDFDDLSFDSSSSRHTSSKKSRLIQKLKKWGRSKDDSTMLLGGLLRERKGDGIPTSHSCPGHRHLNSREPLEVSISRNSSDSVSISTFGAREDDPGIIAGVKSHRPHDMNDATITLLDSPERFKCLTTRTTVENDDLSNNVTTSLQPVTMTMSRMNNGEYFDFKDRHNFNLQKEETIKEKAEQARKEKFADNIDTQTHIGSVGTEMPVGMLAPETAVNSGYPNEHPRKWQEVNKVRLVETCKRAPRIAKATSRPLSGSSYRSAELEIAGGVPMTTPAPLSPAAPGMPPHLSLPPNSLLKPQGSIGGKMNQSPEGAEFYQSLRKREAKEKSATMTTVASSNIADAPNDIIGEFKNRSEFLLAVKADVENQGDFVHSLATEVRAAAYTKIKDVVAFVDWLDEELSFLVDEHSVLKHFDWPAGKVDALREAAYEYRDLQNLKSKVASFVDDPQLSCDVALKNMFSLLEVVEQSLYALLHTRDMTTAHYREFSIPNYWLLDSGLVGKIKFASVQLARKCMERVASELDTAGSALEKEPDRELLLLQGVHFAFRVHQFAGGFDSESMQAFEDLRSRAHAHARESSKEDSIQ